MTPRPTKITFGQMRASGVRGVLAYLSGPQMQPPCRDQCRRLAGSCAAIGHRTGLRLHRLRQRVEQLNISRVCLDAVAGLPSGLAAKFLAPNGTKRVGPLSLDLLLPAVGLKMALVDDREQFAKMAPMYEERKASQARPGNQSRRSKGRRKPKPTPAPRKKATMPKRKKPYLADIASHG